MQYVALMDIVFAVIVTFIRFPNELISSF